MPRSFLFQHVFHELCLSSFLLWHVFRELCFRHHFCVDSKLHVSPGIVYGTSCSRTCPKARPRGGATRRRTSTFQRGPCRVPTPTRLTPPRLCPTKVRPPPVRRASYGCGCRRAPALDAGPHRRRGQRGLGLVAEHSGTSAWLDNPANSMLWQTPRLRRLLAVSQPVVTDFC